MDLEKLIETLQQKRLNDSDAGLLNSANGEKYLQQSYEGRYLFELIQNGRDANKLAEMNGKITVEVKNGNVLEISNTGKPFDKEGVESITMIGNSPKGSQDFIGFKGIGFKSVLEISDTPKVVTKWGTIEFSRKKTKELLKDSSLPEEQVPVFFIPHYSAHNLADENLTEEIVTKIILPFNHKVDSSIIRQAFEDIGVEQILLLGSIDEINFGDGDYKSFFKIYEDPQTGIVTVQKNKESYKYKHFTPVKRIDIPDEIIQGLEDKEKEIFGKQPSFDVSLVFDVDAKNRLQKMERSKLYLFYPTEITSGFNFIIHSYFLVNPERKALRNSILNRFMLKSIAEYISNEWLQFVKTEFKNSFLDLLVFERNKEAPILDTLYDCLVENLKDQKFIYVSGRRQFRIDEIMIADGEDKGLFPEHQISGKRLVYIGNPITVEWLKKEFNAACLTNKDIEESIEKECLIQKKKKNVKYFQRLYQYISDTNLNLDLDSKKILLTSKMRLVSASEDVFYGYKDNLELPDSIQRKIHFIHPNIKISDLRKSQTGFIEYNTERLVQRLLRLYNDKSVDKLDILVSLLRLKVSERLFSEVRQKILLPVCSAKKWVNPLISPVYIEQEKLRELYTEEKFIDYEILSGIDISTEDLNKKLIDFGAWAVPAVYFEDTKRNINYTDDRFVKLRTIEWFTTDYFEVVGDWVFDIPKRITNWFTRAIINNWVVILRTIEDSQFPSIKYSSSRSDYRILKKEHHKIVISAVKFLQEEAWIKLENYEKLLTVNDVVGIGQIEYQQSHSSLIRKYLKILSIDYSYHENFINLIGLRHLDTSRINDFKKILFDIAGYFSDVKIYNKEFESFYNRILGKLSDLYNKEDFDRDDINSLEKIDFLGHDLINNTFVFKPADEIYYIEDKANYEILPDEIKKLIQPQFTNRDKNRFGRIGKKLGIDYRKIFEQKVEGAIINTKILFTEWCMNYAEALSLVENLLETNLDEIFIQLKGADVLLCSSFNVAVYKDSRLVNKRSDVPFTIQASENYSVYCKETEIHSKNDLFSDVLYNLLTEILERDLSRIRVQLSDFFKSNGKSAFLDKYDVSFNRIEEIKAKFNDFIATKEHLFWIPILKLKGVENYLDFFSDGNVDLLKIADLTRVPFDKLSEIMSGLDYNEINSINHINLFSEVFTELKIDITSYNSAADVRIDFREYYSKQLEGLQQKAKSFYAHQIYQKLNDKGRSEQRKFQDILDVYSNNPLYNFSDYILHIDVEKEFIKRFNIEYPDIILDQKILHSKIPKPYLETYAGNEILFKKGIDTISQSHYVEEFLEINVNRSLLYFDDSQEVLTKLFKNYCVDGAILEDNNSTDFLHIDFDKYQNPIDLKITKMQTGATGAKNGSYESKSGFSGKRTDGGKKNDKHELIGIVAEKSVYDILAREHEVVEWISKNASKAKVNPEGSDSHGYDISYIDKNNKIQYVEVKGKESDQKHFFISQPEYRMALEKKEDYRIVLVLNALDVDNRNPIDIGNVFLLEEDESIFNNSKYSANFKNLEIFFK